MGRKKIILDCDQGMDDSMAIVMAVKSPLLEVKAITTVNGNYPVEVTAANALKILEMRPGSQRPPGVWAAGEALFWGLPGIRIPCWGMRPPGS